MYVFSRRAIQECLDGLQPSLTVDQCRALAHRLNRKGSQRYATVWETVLLSALDRIGDVQFELPLDDGRSPDVLFKYPMGPRCIRLDITCVSDAGAEERNPIARFVEEIELAAVRAGVRPNGLYVHVEHIVDAKGRPQLLLPTAAQRQGVISSFVKPFLEEIRRSHRAIGSIEIKEPGIAVQINYDQSQPFLSFNHVYFKRARSLQVNSLWNALKAKARQMRSVNASEMKGFLVCDAGCDLLFHSSSWDRVGVNEIVLEFLRQNRSLSFIAVLSSVRQTSGGDASYRIEARVWTARDCIRSDVRLVRNFVSELVDQLPRPITDAANGAQRSQLGGYGYGNLGGWKMSSGAKWVQVPSRALLSLLAGDLSPAEFSATFRDGGLRDPFKRAVLEGRMITGLRIMPAENEQDDWITFEFGTPDALVSPFVVKQAGDGK